MKRILVAEDNDSNFLLMNFILKNNYEIIRAINGKDAVEKATLEHPDLILMDMKMPVMGGIEATRLIRVTYPDLPIIAVTANAFDSDRQNALEAGCNDFLAKPVTAAACLKCIERLLHDAECAQDVVKVSDNQQEQHDAKAYILGTNHKLL